MLYVTCLFPKLRIIFGNHSRINRFPILKLLSMFNSRSKTWTILSFLDPKRRYGGIVMKIRKHCRSLIKRRLQLIKMKDNYFSRIWLVLNKWYQKEEYWLPGWFEKSRGNSNNKFIQFLVSTNLETVSVEIWWYFDY